MRKKQWNLFGKPVARQVAKQKQIASLGLVSSNEAIFYLYQG
jgi:hypothetical protein